VSQNAQFLSPAETARRLGVSPKALRLYEERGLVKSLRASNGWRTYGPEQIETLHKITALKRMGFSLARIAELLKRGDLALATVLFAQEEALSKESERAMHALAIVRTARRQLASGQALSVDDLIRLTKETNVSTKGRREEMKAIFDPIVDKHFSAGDRRALGQRAFDQEEASRGWDSLIAEATALMANGDPGSPAARDLARRWMALVGAFTGGDLKLAAKAKSVWTEAMADPEAAPKLPLNPEIFAFVGEAWKKAQTEG
jgi:MerR family transcriptional regulator, thiopeptide resistance regulator